MQVCFSEHKCVIWHTALASALGKVSDSFQVQTGGDVLRELKVHTKIEE
jgi:hypothetical protein